MLICYYFFEIFFLQKYIIFFFYENFSTFFSEKSVFPVWHNKRRPVFRILKI